MAEFEERKRFWRIFYSPLVFMILLVAFIFMVRAVWRIYAREQVSAQDLHHVQSELATVNARKAVLQEKVDVLQTPQGVDDDIRSKFNVSKVGEGVAMIVNTDQATTSTTTPVSPKSWWQSFVSFFGH